MIKPDKKTRIKLAGFFSLFFIGINIWPAASTLGEINRLDLLPPRPTLTSPPPTPTQTPASEEQNPSELSITLLTDLPKAMPGNRVTFTVWVTNISSAKIPATEVRLPIPPSLVVEAITTTKGRKKLNNDNNTVKAWIGPVHSGETVVVQVITRVAPNAAEGQLHPFAVVKFKKGAQKSAKLSNMIQLTIFR